MAHRLPDVVAEAGLGMGDEGHAALRQRRDAGNPDVARIDRPQGTCTRVPWGAGRGSGHRGRTRSITAGARLQPGRDIRRSTAAGP